MNAQPQEEPSSRLSSAHDQPPRRRRADALRNADAVLTAAKAVFATSGVDAPAKEITDLAGVGVGTLYRHFPQRSDLVKAVLTREIDACADAAAALSAAHPPREALDEWIRVYTGMLATKQGLASALHKGDPMFDSLAAYFLDRLGPALASLLETAAASGEVRSDISARELLYAVALLCLPTPDEGAEYNLRMVAIFLDGLRPRPS